MELIGDIKEASERPSRRTSEDSRSTSTKQEALLYNLNKGAPGLLVPL